jgi:U3 small nucleolar RNA-associated protein 14
VRNLPHNYSNADQFDYMQSEPIGAEWSSFNQFKDNIKPKVITKPGQLITPIKLPKKIEEMMAKSK